MEITAEYQSVVAPLLEIRGGIRRGQIRIADLEEALIRDLLEVAFASNEALRSRYIAEYTCLKTAGDIDKEISYIDDIITNLRALGEEALREERRINAMQKAQESVLPEELRGLAESSPEHRTLDPVKVFLAQNRDGKDFNYQRMDVIIKYLAIENYYHKNNYGFALYQKLQCLRQKQSGGLPVNYEKMCVNVFTTLISSIEKEQFKKDSCITCDEDLTLIDGAHRLAACLYFGIREMNARVLQLKVCMSSPFTTAYLRAGGFTEEELALINAKTKELMEKYRETAETRK